MALIILSFPGTGKKHTPQNREGMCIVALNRKHFPKAAYVFIVEDILLKETNTYISVRKGVLAIGWDQGYITNRLKRLEQGE